MTRKAITELRRQLAEAEKSADEHLLTTFGQRLKEVRKGNLGMTQEDAAASLGVSRTQLTNMEAGKSGTTLRGLVDLCELYQCSADWLLGLEKDGDS